MQAMIDELAKQAEAALSQVSSKETLATFWQEYLSKNGKIPALMKNLRSVAPEERPAMGKIINELKAKVQAEYDAAAEKVKALASSSPYPALAGTSGLPVCAAASNGGGEKLSCLPPEVSAIIMTINAIAQSAAAAANTPFFICAYPLGAFLLSSVISASKISAWGRYRR